MSAATAAQGLDATRPVPLLHLLSTGWGGGGGWARHTVRVPVLRMQAEKL